MMWLIEERPACLLKVAVTDSAVVASDNWHAPVPLHAPLHPANAEPAAGVAVSCTDVPEAKFALHVVPQLIPAGLLVTVPEPVPARVTVTEPPCGLGVGEFPDDPEDDPPPQPDSKPMPISRVIDA